MITRLNTSRADMFVHLVEGRDGARLRGFRRANRASDKWVEFGIDPLACEVLILRDGPERHLTIEAPIAGRLTTTLCGKDTNEMHRTGPMGGILLPDAVCGSRFDKLTETVLA